MPLHGGVTLVLAEQGGSSMVVHPETGIIYITDSQHHCIVTCTPLGQIAILAGLVDIPGNIDGAASVATFNSPFGIVMDSASVYLYVTCINGFTVRRVVVSTGATTTFAGSGISGKSDGQVLLAQFFSPRYGRLVICVLYIDAVYFEYCFNMCFEY